MFFVLVPFRPADPPLVAGGILGDFATPTVAQDYVIFLIFDGITSRRPLRCSGGATLSFAFPSTRFRPATPLPGDMAVVSIDVFYPLRIGLRSLLLGVPCRLRSLAVQR